MMNYEYFMQSSLAQAKKALSAGEFPVGCVIVYNEQIIATGMRIKTATKNFNELDHAEIRALRMLGDFEKPLEHKEITLFCTLEPCMMCFGAILLRGIGKIVYAYEDVMGGCTSCDLTKISPLYASRNTSIISGVLRQESLELFQKYFADSENEYLKDTLLAKYTLKI